MPMLAATNGTLSMTAEPIPSNPITISVLGIVLLRPSAKLNNNPSDSSPATAPMGVDVTFTFRYWKNLTDEADLPKPLLDRIQGVLGDQVERQLLNRIPKVLSKL